MISLRVIRTHIVLYLKHFLILAMIDNDAFTGSFKKNPFNLKHYNVRDINVFVNPAVKFNFNSGIIQVDIEAYLVLLGKSTGMKVLILQEESIQQDTAYLDLTFQLHCATAVIKNHQEKAQRLIIIGKMSFRRQKV